MWGERPMPGPEQAPRRSSVRARKSRTSGSSADPLRLGPRSATVSALQLQAEGDFAREPARYPESRGRKEFPGSPSALARGTMSAGPAAGPGASGASGASRAPATDSVSALRPAAALPCPVGPSSWRHLHGTSRTRTGGCGRDTRASLGAPARTPTRPARARGPAGGHCAESAQPRCPPRRRQRRAALPAAQRAAPARPGPSGRLTAARTCPVRRAPPSPRLSGWGTPPRSRRSLFPPPFSFPHHRKRRRRRRRR